MRGAVHAPSAIFAEAQLEALARKLEHTRTGAAGSLREGLSETLTVLRLGGSPTLARTLRSTNCIESVSSICRNHLANVKNWQNGDMALRWCAAGLVEAGKQFRPSTATCTFQPCEPPSNGMSPSRVSVPTIMMRS